VAYFTIKTDDMSEPSRYEVPTSLTYGEHIDVFKEFGSDAAALGVIWIAVRRQFPKTTIDDLRGATIDLVEDEEESLPPTYSLVGGSSGENGKPTEHEDTGNLGSESTTG
jgi:hypothetical protein